MIAILFPLLAIFSVIGIIIYFVRKNIKPTPEEPTPSKKFPKLDSSEIKPVVVRKENLDSI